MRLVLCAISIALSVLAPLRSQATTFNLPLNGLIEILGDIPTPVSVSFVFTLNPILPVPFVPLPDDPSIDISESIRLAFR